MPLVATVGSARIESWELGVADWLALKAGYKQLGLLMSCGQPGLPKTSARGTQFFAHRNGTACGSHEGGPETQQHLRAKAIVAEIGRELGWTATVECPSIDRSWIADVMLERDGRRLAVEVQWSTQSESDFRRRQRRYEADGVECLWLAGPANFKNTADVPSYAFSGDIDHLVVFLPVRFGGEPSPVPLAEGLRHVLSGAIRPRVEAIIAGVEIRTTMRRCWSPNCTKWLSLWYVEGALIESRCGQTGMVSISGGYHPWQANRLEQNVQAKVRNAMRGSDLPAPASYEMRHSEIKQVDYAAQICPHCHYVQGDGHIGATWDWSSYGIEVRLRHRFADRIIESPHICIDNGNGSCDQEFAADGPTFPSAETGTWLFEEAPAKLGAPPLPVRKDA